MTKANAMRYTFHNDMHDSVKIVTMAEMMRSFYKSLYAVNPVKAISIVCDSYDSTLSPINATKNASKIWVMLTLSMTALTFNSLRMGRLTSVSYKPNLLLYKGS